MAMMSRLAVVTVALLSLCWLSGLGPAFGQDQPKEQKQSVFQRMDANGDGKVTADEYAALRKARFKNLDANGDGKVSKDEFQKGGMKAVDPDNDDAMTLDEYLIFFVGPENRDKKAEGTVKKDTKGIFAQSDLDGDGVLGVGEVVVFRAAEFKDMDANGDGKVTPEEFQALKEKQFKDLDADGDGLLTVEEFVVVPAK
jgi:Ca2+-binding EF-hand superfamily protein